VLLYAATVTSLTRLPSFCTQPNGFINITLSAATLTDSIAGIIQHGVRAPSLSRLKVLVDFSSPNIAKEMHVGHLRSTIIGDCVCRLLEFCGHEVLRVNHVGDWGTQFGMLITYLQEAFPDILTAPPNISDLTQIYKASKKRFDDDPAFKELSRLNVVRLQSGDEACRSIWQLLCDISRKEFQRVYDALDVQLTEVGESFYNPLIPQAIEEMRAVQVNNTREGAAAGSTRPLVEEDQGMLIAMLDHFSIPLILRKSDGGYGYDSTDMAALKYRTATLQRDWIICITDAGQAPHFHMCFDAARACGWLDRTRADHIGFGVVCGDDGKRFKTRSSETVRLIDLLDAARDRMRESLRVRAEEGKSPLSGDELEAAARTIGYGAVKYFDLKQNPSTNYVFNYDRMLDTKGDTAVYLLFAYARLASILRKAHEERGIDVAAVGAQGAAAIALAHPAERALAFELLQLGDVVKSVIADLLPNRLCDYLKSLAVVFTDFVTKCHVLNAENGMETVHSRLLLCEATRRVMAQCFQLLGIGTLERI
jgi:arginyl-tRNA synthetase